MCLKELRANGINQYQACLTLFHSQDYEKERKKKQQQPKPKGESLPPSIIPDKRVSQIHEKFGGDERAAVMIETLKKLYLGLERGREFQYRQNHRRKTDAGDWSLSEED